MTKHAEKANSIYATGPDVLNPGICTRCHCDSLQLAPVKDEVVCRECWHPERAKYTPYYVQSKSQPHRICRIHCLHEEAVVRAKELNKGFDPEDFAPVEAQYWGSELYSHWTASLHAHESSAAS